MTAGRNAKLGNTHPGDHHPLQILHQYLRWERRLEALHRDWTKGGSPLILSALR